MTVPRLDGRAMPSETVTRLRNAFAQLAIDLLHTAPSPREARAFPPPFSSMSQTHWREAVALWVPHADALLREQPARACPACGGERARHLFRSYDGHPFDECDDCGCWFVPVQVDATLFERFFERCPEARTLAGVMTGARGDATRRESDMSRIGSYLDDLRELIPSPSNRRLAYLDTGCGVGHSLRAGLARGFRVQGVEVDPTAVALAAADGLPVVTPEEAPSAGPYDVLSFWETLEHVADPLDALRAYLPLLADDGLVAITLPNLNAPPVRIQRESCAWVHGGYNTPGHINLFHLSALKTLLGRAGLTVIEAEGRHSNDPHELAAFLAGQTRGAFDALASGAPVGGLPAEVTATIDGAWPGMALIERLAMSSPLLWVVACRQGSEPLFAEAVTRRYDALRERTTLVAESLLASEPDYKALTIATQAEVDRRDALLGEQQALLGELDMHLRAANARFDRTIEGRLRRMLRPLAQRLGRR